MSNILVVDDNENNRQILNDLIEIQGHVPAQVDNGRAAMDYLAEHHVDLVMLDILMPEMNGYEVLEQMKADPVLVHIPVIVISALDELESVVRCIEMGADDYLIKPFNPHLLNARLKSCLERKEMHDALEESYRNLKKAETSRDTLLNMIVHDLKNPLTVVRMNAEMIPEFSSPGQLDDTSRASICTSAGKIVESVDDMSAQISSILDISKLEAGEMPLNIEQLDIAAVLKDVCDLFTTQTEKYKVTLSCKSLSDKTVAMADRHLLTRILQNLVSNAIKHAGKNARVECTVTSSEDAVNVTICDDGPGVPDEFRDKIFDKYFQVESDKKKYGVGLGLAFCRTAVEAQNGTICLEDCNLGGACFHISLPTT
jgi:K+-sensing histidine kinase KdpD